MCDLAVSVERRRKKLAVLIYGPAFGKEEGVEERNSIGVDDAFLLVNNGRSHLLSPLYMGKCNASSCQTGLAIFLRPERNGVNL